MMNISVERITPDIARAYLSKNIVNRNINEKRVTAYAYDMAHGAWETNGEAIKFDKNGNLRDGQHRLSAIVRSNVPVDIVVIRGIDNENSIYDRGRPRDITDSMIFSGMNKELASKINVAIAKLNEIIQKNSSAMSSDYQVKRFIERHRDTLMKLRPLWAISHDKRSGRLSTKSAPLLLAALYALESGESFSDIKNFFSVYRSGLVEDKNQSAAVICRNDVIAKNILSGNGTTDRIMATYVFEKGIYDFCRRYPRTKTYKSYTDQTYSNNVRFRD